MKRVISVLALSLAGLLAGCSHTAATVAAPTTATASQTAEAKLLKVNDILAASANALVAPVTSLGTAGLLTTAQVNEILTYDKVVATTSANISALAVAPGTWEAKLPQIVALVAAIPPVATMSKYTGMNTVQYQAMVTAIQSLVSAVQLIAVEAQP